MVQRGMEEHSALPPGEAFAAVGNEIRIRVLQVIGEADGPLAFSELRERVGTRDSGQFNYHLGKLKDHFVTTVDDGYRLTRAGERVVESILSGAVTEAPVLDRTEVDQVCHFCGAPTEIEYHEERLERYCSECPGMWGSSESGYLGTLALPPSGYWSVRRRRLFGRPGPGRTSRYSHSVTTSARAVLHRWPTR